MNPITGEKFQTINGIEYSHTHGARNKFEEIRKINKRVILITHNSDGKIKHNPDKNGVDPDDVPKNIAMWYGKNVCVCRKNIIPIPIGLENSYCCPNEHKTEKILELAFAKIERRGLLYINHNIDTNVNERFLLYNMFDWATKKRGHNPWRFDAYIMDLKEHMFVLSPEGNGTDTHRTWEALYLGCIPILKRNVITDFFEDKLPILVVDSWSEINQDYLLNEYNRIQKTSTYDMKYLDFNFWRKEIECQVNLIKTQ